MTTIEITIRAFCSEFSLKLKRKHPMTLTDAITFVIKNLEWDTAVIKSIKQNGETINIPESPPGHPMN